MKNRFKLIDYSLELVLVLLVIIFSLFAPGFLGISNILNVLRNISTQGIIAFGMTLLIISGEIDLSVGSLVAFSGCLAAAIVEKTIGVLGGPLSIIIAVLSVLLIAAAIGLITGLLRRLFKLPSFIITLALMTILTGSAYLVTKGFPIAPFPEWYSVLGSGYLGGVLPIPALILIILFFFFHVVSKYTVYGREIYAVGGNPKSARISGINIWKVRSLAFMTTSFLAGLSGILVSSQISSGNAGTARGWELDIIASVIIGGTSFFGGSGRIWGTAVGVLFLGVIINGMTLLNINEYWQYIVRGALILGAVLLNYLQSGKSHEEE